VEQLESFEAENEMEGSVKSYMFDQSTNSNIQQQNLFKSYFETRLTLNISFGNCTMMVRLD
jgi:hypothetical protein